MSTYQLVDGDGNLIREVNIEQEIARRDAAMLTKNTIAARVTDLHQNRPIEVIRAERHGRTRRKRQAQREATRLHAAKYVLLTIAREMAAEG